MYPDSCIFNDVFDMIKNKVPSKSMLKVGSIEFKGCAHCVVHNKQCKFTITKEKLCVLGTPCVLFSRFHGSMVVSFYCRF